MFEFALPLMYFLWVYQVNFSQLIPNQIFSNDFACNHYHLSKISARIGCHIFTTRKNMLKSLVAVAESSNSNDLKRASEWCLGNEIKMLRILRQ